MIWKPISRYRSQITRTTPTNSRCCRMHNNIHCVRRGARKIVVVVVVVVEGGGGGGGEEGGSVFEMQSKS